MRLSGSDAGELMETEQDVCPICGSKITQKIIEYSDWSNGHLLVVRECQANGHRFFQARVARALERVFDMARQNKLRPIEIMQVPVVELDLAA
jgi:hypothetical protein